MTTTELLAKFDSFFRGYIAKLPPSLPIHVYSVSRKWFLRQLFSDLPDNPIHLPPELMRTYWGLNFQSTLFNAAGMFKEGLGYEVSYRQGAGAFLAGTATPHPRRGNIRGSFKTPFLPMPSSRAALNWLGLPNSGFETIAKNINLIELKPNCPIGISISSAPEETGEIALNNLLKGFEIFGKTQVDFIELNESCPNVPHEKTDECINGLDAKLVKRLEFVSETFLKKRSRNLPVIVKFSTDTSKEQIPELVRILVDLGFDGINLGNTSTNYEFHKKEIFPTEINNYDFFIQNFGGGLSGAPLKNDSLALSKIAIDSLIKINLHKEFNIIRTGGIESYSDILESKNAGVQLNQWFTGYFEMYSNFGHKLYKTIFRA